MTKLFIDDERTDPKKCLGWVNHPLSYLYESTDWIIVKSYQEFVDYVVTNGLPYVISFDHDLADEHYHGSMYDKELYNKQYDSFKEKTGLDCAKYLVEYCMDNNIRLPLYLCHSMNPSGKENIMSLLTNFANFQSQK